MIAIQQLSHSIWKDGCLVVTICQHKAEKKGTGIAKEKHVYANPLDPVVCPVLAMAVMGLCRHRGGGGSLIPDYSVGTVQIAWGRF